MNTMLSMCVQGSLMIVAILLVRALVGHRSTHGVLVASWWLVIARMLIPFPASWPVSSNNITNDVAFDTTTGEIQSDILASAASLYSMLTSTSSSTALSITSDMFGVLDRIIFAVRKTLLIIWPPIAIALFCALIALFVYGLRRLCKTSASKNIGFNITMRRTVRVRESRGLGSPVACGVLHPTIVVPSGLESTLTPQQLNLVMRHEVMHIRHFDTLCKLLLAIVACIYWFNPLSWLMFAAASHDIELACDERTLRACTRSERADYARALILFCEESRLQHSRPITIVTNGFGLSQTETRIHAITRKTTPRLAALAFCALLACTPLAALAASAAVAPVEFDQPNTPTISISNDYYTIDIPSYWKGKVLFHHSANTCYVYPAGYPDLWLAAITIDDHEPGLCSSPTSGSVLFDVTTDNGAHITVHAINYVSLAAGGLWETSASTRPSWQGSEAEAIVLDLSTGGEWTASEVHALPARSDSGSLGEEGQSLLDAASSDALGFYRKNLVITAVPAGEQ